jgi:hypothetical protein
MGAILSSQSDYWLKFFTQNPSVRINYRTLMKNGVSKRKSLAILKELRDANYIKIVRLAGGGTNVKVVTSDVPTVGTSDIAVDAVQPISYISNSSIASTSSYATNKFFDEVEEEGKTVGYDFFESTSSDSDELIRERGKHLAQKKAEYEEAREKKAQQRKDLHRANLDPVHWTCKDVAYEFADRMANIWSIKPFSVTQSRFVQALAVFRKQHDTNGALEIELINMFFSTLQAEKYTDGNHLWRAFLYKAPLLLQSAKDRVVSAEDVQTAIVEDQQVSSKKLALLEDEDV